MILHLSRMRRNVNRKVYNDRENVSATSPLSTTCVNIPRHVLHGLLTALHIQLDHPTSHQLKLVVHRFFCALDMDKAIEEMSSKCHQCASLRNAPRPHDCKVKTIVYIHNRNYSVVPCFSFIYSVFNLSDNYSSKVPHKFVKLCGNVVQGISNSNSRL